MYYYDDGGDGDQRLTRREFLSKCIAYAFVFGSIVVCSILAYLRKLQDDAEWEQLLKNYRTSSYRPLLSDCQQGGLDELVNLLKQNRRILPDELLTQYAGAASIVVGVHVPKNNRSFEVYQQPANNPSAIDKGECIITQSKLAISQPAIGLIAHNYRAGQYFYDLNPNDSVNIITANGDVLQTIVSNVKYYKATAPTSPFSDLIPLNDRFQPTGSAISSGQAFHAHYGQNQITLQTCLSDPTKPASRLQPIDWSWGRSFFSLNQISRTSIK